VENKPQQLAIIDETGNYF